MGVARYKSTGDMLASSELVGGYRKRLNSGECNEDDSADEEASSSSSKFAHHPTSDPPEAAKLLNKRRQQVEDEEDNWNQSMSVKFLGNQRDWHEPAEEEASKWRLEGWSKHWKSVGDFLALNMQNHQPEPQDSRRPKGKLAQDELYERPGLWGSAQEERAEATQVRTRARRRRPTASGGGRLKASGARRGKAAAAASSRATGAASALSLSSPAIAQRKQQQQQQREEEAHLRTELEGRSGLVMRQVRQDPSSETFDGDARGTMAPAPGPMDHNSGGELHCFVDVAHLQHQLLQQQQQRQLSARRSDLPSHNQVGQPWPTQAANGGSGSNDCYADDYNRVARQDNSGASDNGIGPTQVATGHRWPLAQPPEGVGGEHFRGSSTAAGEAAAAAAGGHCGGAGIHQPESRVAAAEPSAQSAASSALASTMTPGLGLLPLQNWHSRQQEHTGAAATDYAPSSQAAGGHGAGKPHQHQQQEQRPPEAADQNHSLLATLKQAATATSAAVVGAASWRADRRSSESATERNCSPVACGADRDLSSQSIATAAEAKASKLMGSCCDSWRYALQPSKSGTYKVAQHQQQVAPISGTNLETARVLESGTQQQQQQQQQQETVASGQRASSAHSRANYAANTASEQRKLRTRPGRSPVSLQRQTNARLARHRLKIQQQRQEQLTQLAIRERQQLNSQQPQSRIQQTYTEFIEEAPLEQNNQNSIFLVNGLLDRFRSSQEQHQSQSNNTIGGHRNQKVCLQTLNRCARPGGPSAAAAAALAHQQQRVIIPNATRIEICDNQLACSSRGCDASRTPQHTYSSFPRSEQRFGGNVIVYKSIDMLRNAATANGDNRQASNGSGLPDDEIESELDTISSEGSTLSLNKPFCKVCHIGATKNGDKLISPCRCSGTMQYIHCGCLLKWLEISNRSNEKPMSCELCAHEYTWHKKFNYRQIGWPKCSLKDALLHLIFLAALGVMLFSAISPMFHKKFSDTSSTAKGLTTQPAGSTPIDQQYSHHLTDKNLYPAHSTTTASTLRSKHATGHLADDEKFMLICAASFFVSFFLAIYVQTKARDTLYGLIVKFLNMNQTYYITEYDHGQLSNNSGGNSKHQQQQQQQHVEDSFRGVDRKSSAQKS